MSRMKNTALTWNRMQLYYNSADCVFVCVPFTHYLFILMIGHGCKPDVYHMLLTCFRPSYFHTTWELHPLDACMHLQWSIHYFVKISSYAWISLMSEEQYKVE